MVPDDRKIGCAGCAIVIILFAASIAVTAITVYAVIFAARLALG